MRINFETCFCPVTENLPLIEEVNDEEIHKNYILNIGTEISKHDGGKNKNISRVGAK